MVLANGSMPLRLHAAQEIQPPTTNTQFIAMSTTNTHYTYQDEYTSDESHSVVMGYLLWIFGFTGAHRFYFGKPVSGTIWFFTLGLLGVGWLIDVLLVPGMQRQANHRYLTGECDYNVAWLLLTFLGWAGVHRFYMGKWLTGILYLLTGGLFVLGILYDFWTLNEQVDDINAYA